MFSTLPMGEGGDTRQKYHQNVKSLIIFARDCREPPWAVFQMAEFFDRKYISFVEFE